MPPDLDAAARFLAAHARVLERRRFERLFAGGPPEPVRDAIAAYRNPDGGFGHALEPDGRTPSSQPAAAALALRTLDEADAWDPALVAGTCDWLQATAPAAGGAVFVAPGVEAWPHAPWWQAEPGLPPSLVCTGPIAAVLLARGVRHAWLDRATAWLWGQVETLDDPQAYEMLGVAAFLEHAPDPDRVEAVLPRVERVLLGGGLVALDPQAPGETHGPLDFAPRPGSPLRRCFDEATIAAHLDALEAGQREDGGWTFDWPAWSPVAEAEWRGAVTVEALLVLRANGRLP